ncbi:rolling circle replication-associated protein [Spiroplasma endosymbiont of Danaus chrysippus]|uniref:rolling circle replication-associated protein n=1 Tax=Spiroplasma endosymbiont of Danaus chrysippus TaxID=2691041 RepID=UPI00157B3A88|nr:hypothetical protein [Spiroplasma endosymbiont of Danaus chrysippus]
MIQKALHNFCDSQMLSFLTLTYKDNMQDIRKAKKDIPLFFLKLKKRWNEPKRSKYLGELKHFYVYEYQTRGAVHFHILFNSKIPYSMIIDWWPHAEKQGIKLIVVKKVQMNLLLNIWESMLQKR